MIPKEALGLIADCLNKGRIVALTGAGISSESGIPTFRGKGGLWERFDPKIFANVPGLIATFLSKPSKVVDFATEFYQVLLNASPNPAHLILAELERKNLLSCVITQNVDNLHWEAGSKNVIELHGNAYRARCTRCKRRLYFSRENIKNLLNLLNKYKSSRFTLLKVLSEKFPKCVCGGRFRLDIVLFGETLPEAELNRAYEFLSQCSLLLLIGASGMVYPAAGLPSFAKSKSAVILEINSSPTELSAICEYCILGPAGKILPEIFAQVL